MLATCLGTVAKPVARAGGIFATKEEEKKKKEREKRGRRGIRKRRRGRRWMRKGRRKRRTGRQAGIHAMAIGSLMT